MPTPPRAERAPGRCGSRPGIPLGCTAARCSRRPHRRPCRRQPLALAPGRFQAVGDERERRSVIDPRLWDRAADNKDRHIQGVFATPPMGEVEGPSTKHQRPGRFACLAEELGGLRRDPEDHVGSRQPVFGVASGVSRQEPLAADPHGCISAVVRPTDKAVERDREPGGPSPCSTSFPSVCAKFADCTGA